GPPGSSRCTASMETAAVRRVVTVGPSSNSRSRPVTPSYTETTPLIVGRPSARLSGATLTSLWMPTSAAVAGMDNMTAPPGDGTACRAGAHRLPAAGSPAARAITRIKADNGNGAAVPAASQTGVSFMLPPLAEPPPLPGAGRLQSTRRGAHPKHPGFDRTFVDDP